MGSLRLSYSKGTRFATSSRGVAPSTVDGPPTVLRHRFASACLSSCSRSLINHPTGMDARYRGPRKWQNVVELAVLGLLGTCAFILTVLLVKRELAATSSAEPRVATHGESVPNWELVSRGGNRVGPEDAQVVITVFGDYQCGFCRRFEQAIEGLRAESPGAFAVVYRHFPIEGIHPHAYRAALAAECAAAIGQFLPMHQALYSHADSLGSRTIARLAWDAGIRDTASFRTCVAEERYAHRITSDVTAAGRLGVRATPTFLVNDQLFRGAVSSARLDSLMRSVVSRAQ